MMISRYMEAWLKLAIIAGLAIIAVIAPARAQDTRETPATSAPGASDAKSAPDEIAASEEERWIGTDVAMGSYERNLEAFANVARIAESGDRVLVVYGAGHENRSGASRR